MAVYEIPAYTAWFFRSVLIKLHTHEKLICLSFDDGPDPESTFPILQILEKYNIRAIFFCTGERGKKFPDLMSLLKDQGHLIGNHSFSHYDGFKTPKKKYLNDIELAADITSNIFFRPPYGRMLPGQYLNLRQKYKIILWHLLADDYSEKKRDNKIAVDLLKKLTPGSIVALHDKPVSLKRGFLEEFITGCLNSGYSFVLPDYIT
ncbi:MAG TPA: polysaccharide deacetylase family protein [Bacteroidales bacterium]|nr:polysaccharide deacetylase family protein [Bacteroidales bacterium]HOU95489.1 polysaccharide deacetylase family protein [Bacteroidales bacterium]HQG36256.1 polysaccharide deacetylase family protein [Bacteroidales bacterium]HQG52252.1 polysaccharide deacetylase family protein [Bacteroidales bacterium]HQJ19888.1 polysaccharide deacetylase family protein [Bacteroidales bacterium]